MDKALVPQSLSVPTGWQGLVLRNVLEKMGGGPMVSLEPCLVKARDLRAGQGARYRTWPL